MAWATSNRADIRQQVLRQLYTYADVLQGTASGGSATTITDIGTTDGVTLESAVYSSNAYAGKWAYVGAVTAPNQAVVSQYDRDAGTLTLDRALGATASAQVYEIHYLLPPLRLNDIIEQIAEEASSGAMTTLAEATAINIDKFTLAEGSLALALREIAKSRRGDSRKLLEMEADHHEMLYMRLCANAGYTPLVDRLGVEREDSEAVQVWSR